MGDYRRSPGLAYVGAADYAGRFEVGKDFDEDVFGGDGYGRIVLALR